MEAERAGIVRMLAVLVLALAVTAPVPAARADSIWDRRRPSTAFLYTDNLAADVGDSLTVLISERSTFSHEADRELEKTSSSAASANFNTPLIDVNIASGNADHQSSRTFEGSVDYNGERLFADSITVTVTDRLPNGNLVVAGRSIRLIAGEEVVTILTGIVKPEDISGANTVSSARVAYLGINYETSGASEKFVKDGGLSRILSLLWPF